MRTLISVLPILFESLSSSLLSLLLPSLLLLLFVAAADAASEESGETTFALRSRLSVEHIKFFLCVFGDAISR